MQPEGGAIPFLLPIMIEFPQDLNKFSYSTNNPINASDPFGLFDIFGRSAWRWMGIPFENPIDRELRIWQGAISNVMSATASYGGCTAMCIGRVLVLEGGAQALQKGLMIAAKKVAAKAALKLIPIAGWVSTAYSGFSVIECLVVCSNCE